MNSVNLIGRLTRDPETTDSKSGRKVCRMGFAVHNRRRDADPVFIDVVAFERQAEVCQEHLGKGRMIAVQGRLDFNRWNGPDGKQRSVHSVIADRVEFLSDGRPTEPQSQAPQAQQPQQAPAYAGYGRE